MNIEKGSRLSAYIMALPFLVMSFVSCKKDGPTKAIIGVIDSFSLPVQGAKITLWQDTAVNSVNGIQSKIRVTKTSDAAGKAEFEFKLEAFLNIDVIRNLDTVHSFIRLKEHETVFQQVKL